MRNFQSTLGLIAFICVLFWANFGYSRRIELWNYGRLMKEADLVVIADVAVIRPDDGPRPAEFGKDDKFVVAERVTLNVDAVMKGEAGLTVDVRNFRYRDGVPTADGPYSAKFRERSVPTTSPAPSPLQAGKKGKADFPVYLLFLKAEGHGVYRPVSGYYDASWSIVELEQGDGRNEKAKH